MIAFFIVWLVLCTCGAIYYIYDCFTGIPDDFMVSLWGAISFIAGIMMFGGAIHNVWVAHEEASRPCIEWVNPDGQLVTDSECLRNKP
jgi:hypothetical protein